MWSYYGSKCKIARLYPKPEYDIIIEPFAGAAWYSVLHRTRNVLLNEKYSGVYSIWEWLTKTATADILLTNKDYYVGQDISGIELHPAHRSLIGFCINRGSTQPKNIVQKWSCQVAARPDWASTVSYQLERIARRLDEIKHWQVRFGDYRDLPDVEATWFIDPPYQYGGEHYVVSDIDYTELARWCRSRKGQVIVCENSRADWLPFKPLIEITGQRKKTHEVVWTNKEVLRI